MGKGNKHAYVEKFFLTAGLCLFMILSGCGPEKTDRIKLQDVDYCIVEEDEIPKELEAKIMEKKAADLKMVFENDEYTYIVRGYGEQETGGYSIQITEVFLTKNAVIFRSNLVGPAKDEIKSAVPSYPYVVIKIQNIDKNVIFE